MEVETAESQQFSFWYGLRYISAAILISAFLYAPALVFSSWIRVLTSLMLVALLFLTGRALFSALITFVRPRTPELDDEAELPSVSVVIPAYNEAAVLPETIEACKSLGYDDDKLEVILCYEADSVDNTEEICESAARDSDRFVAVRRDEPGGGKAKATNYALRHATGEIIASIDADHRFKPDAIKRAVAWFQRDEDIWCVKGRCYGDNAEDSLLALHATIERHIAEKGDLFARQLFGGFTIFGGGQAFFRKKMFDELGEFDETVLVEDIDMSSKIHQYGKKLRVDPSIITFEENPATLQSWWSQRKRWARGWMQVAFRYLTRLPRNRNVSPTARIDSAFTFFYALVPVFVAFTFPLLALAYFGINTSTYLPFEQSLWRILAAAPALAVGCVFIQDYRDGLSHDWREYLAPVTLWFYLALQSIVYVVSFLDEVVFGRPSVYVTTARVESEAGD
ncbi:hypothetical protein AQV86_04910 [Nanohaloarchaea archaeon SG9]|nr:hypothetical protein AQV86_04910 [Nanohaloarchaea archaeon SG9]